MERPGIRSQSTARIEKKITERGVPRLKITTTATQECDIREGREPSPASLISRTRYIIHRLWSR
jgi:hypothetical protein